MNTPSRAHAFSEPRTYYDGASFGGGGGRWFTSSPADGLGCTVCHSGGGTPKLEITGLPSDGYAPGATYEFTIAWPEFAARANMLRALAPAEPPMMGLVAELVPESGLGAGRLELLEDAALLPGERCPPPPGATNVQGDRGAELYLQRPGEVAEQVQRVCDADPATLANRCLLATVPCASELVRARWTAPPQSVGPVWFALGFVSTDAVSGNPQNDSVLELAHPILPQTSSAERYESMLEGGCSVARVSGSGPSNRDAYLLVSMLLSPFVARSARARVRRAARKEQA